MNGKEGPPAKLITKWPTWFTTSGSTVVDAWSLALASGKDMLCWSMAASWAAISNSFTSLEIALLALHADCNMDGSIGQVASATWDMINQDHPWSINSQATSSLGTTMATPSGEVQPCWMALRKAVVWELERLRKPQMALPM